MYFAGVSSVSCCAASSFFQRAGRDDAEPGKGSSSAASLSRSDASVGVQASSRTLVPSPAVGAPAPTPTATPAIEAGRCGSIAAGRCGALGVRVGAGRCGGNIPVSREQRVQLLEVAPHNASCARRGAHQQLLHLPRKPASAADRFQRPAVAY